MQVVVRALSVLRALAPKAKGATLQELHEELAIPVGSLHRVLATLTDEGFVTRSPRNRRYFLGPVARQLAEQNSGHSTLLVTPHSAITNAAAASGETVFLTELIGDRAVCVALREGRHPLRLFVRIGQEMPWNAAASARALLAHQPQHVAHGLLEARPLDPFTEDTPTTIESIDEHLALVRARGYDVCDDELDRGVWAVAAPTFTSTGSVAASVTLAAAGGRMRDPQVRSQAVETVLATARELSDELGFVGDWPVLDPAAASSSTHQPKGAPHASAPSQKGTTR
ncbi:IclR family transcriptional regulator [Streptomyces sulphureus]|uniref:IclR family transcriptional regulator n=1 Tax=Streptomyces sulphureus TaxID=47758 RepID=UPI00038285CA|nr:IclR family transcriptional regulator [Streptomyces sulphureus]